jgi:hypothetical protein
MKRKPQAKQLDAIHGDLPGHMVSHMDVTSFEHIFRFDFTQVPSIAQGCNFLKQGFMFENS